MREEPAQFGIAAYQQAAAMAGGLLAPVTGLLSTLTGGASALPLPLTSLGGAEGAANPVSGLLDGVLPR